MTTTTTDGTIFQFIEGTHSYKGKWIGDKSETEPYWWIKSFIEELEEHRISRQQQVTELSDEINILDALYESCKDKIKFGNISALNPLQEIRDMCAMALQKANQKLPIITDAKINPRVIQADIYDCLNNFAGISNRETISRKDFNKVAKLCSLILFENKTIPQSIPSNNVVHVSSQLESGEVVKEETPRMHKSELLDKIRSERDPIEHEKIRQEMLSVSASKEQPVKEIKSAEECLNESCTVFGQVIMPLTIPNILLAMESYAEQFKGMSSKGVQTEGLRKEVTEIIRDVWATRGATEREHPYDENALSRSNHRKLRRSYIPVVVDDIMRLFSATQTDDKLKELIRFIEARFNIVGVAADILNKATELLNQVK